MKNHILQSLSLTISFASCKEKWLKNVIFHDFFKVLLDVLRWYCRYVEMFLEHLGGVLSLRTYFWPHFKSLGDKDFCHLNRVIRQNSQKKWILIEYSGGVEYSTGPKNFEVVKYTIRPFQNRFDHPSRTILRWDTDTYWGVREKNIFIPLAYTTLEWSSIYCLSGTPPPLGHRGPHIENVQGPQKNLLGHI